MSGQPGDHPLPASGLSSCKPRVFTLQKGTILLRHHLANLGALYYGKSGDYRFDDPKCAKGQNGFGVMYAGEDVACCFAESCLKITGGPLTLTTSFLDARAISTLEVTRDLTFIDLMDSGGLASIGADSRLFTGDYSVSQAWSAALKKLTSNPDGIRYPSRHDHTRVAYAIYGPRPDSLFKVTSLGSLTDPRNKTLLSDLVGRYSLTLISS